MAGFGLRLGAMLLDTLFITLFAILLTVVLFLIAKPELNPASFNVNNPQVMTTVLFYLIGFPLLTLLYQTIFESSFLQGTPGKIIVKIFVINYKGGQASFWRCLLRNISRLFSSFLMIGYLMVLFTKKKQALHDILSCTYVIQGIYAPRTNQAPEYDQQKEKKETANKTTTLEEKEEDYSRFMPH